jgi:ribose-phosphate pyrophosphokinase
MFGNIKLFAGTGSVSLAEEIAQKLGMPLCGRDIIRFPNENIFVRLHESVRGQDAFVIQTTSSPVQENLMELLIMIDCLKRDSAGRITAVVPYLAYARSDKKDQPRVPITARLVADMITVAGADRWMTIDLHAGQIQGFFSIPGDELTSFHLLSDYLQQKQLHNGVVVTADFGFAKKGRNLAAKLHLPMAFVEKRRLGNLAKAEAMNVIGDVTGKDVIIVDDEVDTASSVVQAIEIVMAHGARDIYLVMAHAVLSPPALDRLRALPIREIISSNTVPVPPEKRLPNMTVISVGGLLAEVILRVHEGRSVGQLFNE